MKRTILTTTVLAGLMAAPAVAQSTGNSYCEQGYTIADTDNDGMIGAEELATARTNQFNDFDANGDGTISKEEFTACAQGWAKADALSPTEDGLPEGIIAELDANSDGSVDQNEFMTAAQSAYEDKVTRELVIENLAVTEETATEGLSGQQSDGTDMASADASEAGPITEQTPRVLLLRRVMQTPVTRVPTPAPTDLAADDTAARAAIYFIARDGDGNGQLTQSEMRERFKAQDLMVHVADYMGREFDAADADGSGDLSRQEYYTHGLRKWQQAQLEGYRSGDGDGIGAPVVYYRLPQSM